MLSRDMWRHNKKGQIRKDKTSHLITSNHVNLPRSQLSLWRLNKQSRRESCRRYHFVPPSRQLAAGQLVFESPGIQFLKKTYMTYWDYWNCVLACWLAQSRAKKAFQTSFSQKVRKSQKCEVRNKNHGNNALPLHHCMLKWHSLLPGDPPLKVATLSGEIWEMVSGRAVLKSHEG